MVGLFNDGERALVLYGEKFATPEAAVDAARAWRQHLSVALARYGMGADFGDDSNPWRPDVFERAAAAGKGVALNYFNLSVYEEGFDIVLGSGPFQNPQRPEPKPLEELVDGPITEVSSEDYDLTEQQKLAYSLLHAAFFESNPETKNVTLVTAVESIIVQAPRSAEIVAALNALVEQTKRDSDLTSEAQQTIMNAVGNVKQQSINEAGQILARQYLRNDYDGLRPDQFFKRSYVDRCSLVHGSTARPTTGVLNLRNPILSAFVAELLDATVFGSPTDGTSSDDAGG